MSQFIEMFSSEPHTVQIKDICSVVSGKSIPTNLEDAPGEIPYIKVADFNNPGNERYIITAQRYVAKESADYSRMIPIGSVIFAKNGAASMSNKKRLTRIRCCIDMNTMAVIPTCDDILPEFLFATIEAIDISTLVRQGAIPSISPKSIEEYYIALPTREEQTQYISIAQQADKSEFDVIKSQFIEMFKDSHKVGLGQLATFINGSAFKPEDWSTEGLPIVRIQNLNDTSCEYNYYNGDCSKKIVIDNGDVLVSWSATLGVFIWDKGKALLNQHIFKVVFDKIEIDRDFFIYTVSVALDKMSQHTHGSTMKHIVKSEFNKFPVACPTLSEQKEFAQIAQQADKSESGCEYRMVS